jgi:hypothetical protein
MVLSGWKQCVANKRLRVVGILGMLGELKPKSNHGRKGATTIFSASARAAIQCAKTLRIANETWTPDHGTTEKGNCKRL